MLLDALSSSEVLTNLRIKNFKRLEDVEIELGKTVVFIGPNNSGKTTALQALALWEIGLRRWVEKRSAKDTPEKRPGVTINRRDLIAVPVPDANLLWKDLHVRAIQKENGKQETRNIRIEILVSGVTDGSQWDCGFEFDYANQESFYCRPLRITMSQDHRACRFRKWRRRSGSLFCPPCLAWQPLRTDFRRAPSTSESAKAVQQKCSGTFVFRFTPIATRQVGKRW